LFVHRLIVHRFREIPVFLFRAGVLFVHRLFVHRFREIPGFRAGMDSGRCFGEIAIRSWPAAVVERLSNASRVHAIVAR
jgi:hypothetical protein